MDARAAALLREGAAESATFREIVWRLENSDLVIYIKVARLDHRGTVHFVAAAPSYRILCVTIQLPGLADAIPFLAHELQHAVEIGGEPEVRDEASLLRFYGRIGHGFRVGSTTEMETTAAQMVTVTVWKEMTAPVARR